MSEEKSTPTLTEKQEEERWSDLDYLLKRKGPFAQEGFVTEGEFTSKIFLHEYCKVLIIGAGGLGCDLLKNLAMSGFKDIHIIDMDTIDVSNLNRQFLFREKDVGSSKAETAAKFVNERVPGVKVTPFVGKIQDKDDDYYRQFHIIIAGLDSINARQWINKKLCDLVEFKDEEQTIVDMTTVKPLIDGGTEGFKGQARIIYPRVNACFECTMNLFPKDQNFAMCTIASTPRLPEHCVEYALAIQWEETQNKPNIKNGTAIDGDNPTHIKWLYDRAIERAQKFNIRGITYRFTQGVVKKIIPAIASTNAIIASAETLEALKLATLMYNPMDDYMFYNGNEGIFSYTYKNARLDDCQHCCTIVPAVLAVDPKETLQDLIQRIPEVKVVKHHIGKPLGTSYSLVEGKTQHYNSMVPALEKATKGNLTKTLQELGIVTGDELLFTSEGWTKQYPFVVDFGDKDEIEE